MTARQSAKSSPASACSFFQFFLPALCVAWLRISRRASASGICKNRECTPTEKEAPRNFPPEKLLKKCITRWLPAKRSLPFTNNVIQSAVVSRRIESWQKVR